MRLAREKREGGRERERRGRERHKHLLLLFLNSFLSSSCMLDVFPRVCLFPFLFLGLAISLAVVGLSFFFLPYGLHLSKGFLLIFPSCHSSLLSLRVRVSETRRDAGHLTQLFCSFST